MRAGTIYVTNVFDLARHFEACRPAQLVSIIQPEFQPERPQGLAAANHLRIAVHDIVSHDPSGVLARAADVEALLSFIDAWDPNQGPLMTHCYAGVSRSTAAALVAAYMKHGDAEACGIALRAAAPHAQPNRHIIALADAALGCDGDLKLAHRSMGPAIRAVHSAPLTTLRLPA